jgi:hypothetical protein
MNCDETTWEVDGGPEQLFCKGSQCTRRPAIPYNTLNRSLNGGCSDSAHADAYASMRIGQWSKSAPLEPCPSLAARSLVEAYSTLVNRQSLRSLGSHHARFSLDRAREDVLPVT